MIEDITPLLIAHNESANIGRTLDKLCWARRIVIVDSGSTDNTVEIIKRYPQAEILYRSFDTFADQCNFGLSKIFTAWVLSLDADYELSDALVAELHTLAPATNVSGYQARFIYKILGRPLRATLYPPRVVLYRRDGSRYGNEGHGHRVTIVGDVLPLAAPIYHDDRKPLLRWLASQQIYASQDADHLLNSRPSQLGRADQIRRVGWLAPPLVFVYALIVKRCLFDGPAGWYYALQRLFAETLLALVLLERRLASRGSCQ